MPLSPERRQVNQSLTQKSAPWCNMRVNPIHLFYKEKPMSKQKLALTVLTVCCLFLFYGCKGGSMSDTTAATSEVVDDSDEYAKVNDVTISNNDFEQFAKSKHTAQPDANFSDTAIIDELIATELLRQEAVKEGVADLSPSIVQPLQMVEPWCQI